MKCRRCKHPFSIVVDTTSRGDDVLTRRRQCKQCDHRWTTWERAADSDALLLSQQRLQRVIRAVHQALETD